MSIVRALTVLACAAGAVFGTAAPGILVYQSSVPLEKEEKVVFLHFYIEQELRDSGKLDPMVWSQSDPVFRQAVLDSKVRYTSDFPSKEEAEAGAKALGCEYILAITARQTAASIVAEGTLFQNGRQI